MIRLLGLISEKYKAKFFLFGGNEESGEAFSFSDQDSRFFQY